MSGGRGGDLKRALKLWVQVDPYVGLLKIGRECGVAVERIREAAKARDLLRPPRPILSVRGRRRKGLEPPKPRKLPEHEAAKRDAAAARKRKLDERRARLLHLWGLGLDLRTIGRRVGICERQVKRQLAGYGVDTSGARYRVPPTGAGVIAPNNGTRGLATSMWRRT
jgi:hypothetical protein